MKLKKKFKFASKGKQYLEFKQERLMREIKSLWPQYQKMRQKVLSLFKKSLLILNQTYKDMGKTEFEVISMISKIQYDPIIKLRFIKKIGGYITEIEYSSNNDIGLPPFSFSDTSQFLDDLHQLLKDLFVYIIELAELENKMVKYAFNFKKINRRINGLRNIIIPQLNNDIKKIEVMIEELERENFVRLKKTKDNIKKNKIFSM